MVSAQSSNKRGQSKNLKGRVRSYRAISTVPIVFSTFLENSPPFPSSLKLLCAKFKKYDARHIVYRCYSSKHFFQLFHFRMPFNKISLGAKLKIKSMNINHFQPNILTVYLS